MYLEQFSIECCKTKAKSIMSKETNTPVIQNSKQIHEAGKNGRTMCASKSQRFWWRKWHAFITPNLQSLSILVMQKHHKFKLLLTLVSENHSILLLIKRSLRTKHEVKMGDHDTQWGRYPAILPACVVYHSTGLGSSCTLADLPI